MSKCQYVHCGEKPHQRSQTTSTVCPLRASLAVTLGEGEGGGVGEGEGGGGAVPSDETFITRGSGVFLCWLSPHAAPGSLWISHLILAMQ